ncbi:uncharacterized protein MYCFIDRAFT_202759 [Pseudocercospora fijiensis CIRAD86]|uniref:Mediator of RNA polymerase II transcription subunit 21 n=1 Tax=Pseudocercospora fijiensis (strain CIRAD86) TaxID=383855 RepID=M3BD70_PSEFD|nr:uncharacterized protein MYCFIDRAFT_202759 [Pseudocercospora fijiensis CIRAD86]EME87098.1 hypothetical protein MYCFIDRAFT_202759 [Pseudocercospora fijiensis CIRAD86]
MADRLTQLQEFLDDLLMQMYTSLDYIHTRAPYASIPGQDSQAPSQPSSHQAGANGTTAATNGDGDKQGEGSNARANREGQEPLPENPETFNRAMVELAQDLVLKEQMIEHVINNLPGIGNSQAEQERRMKELEQELRTVEEERRKKEVERENMIDMLGEVIGKVKRIP